MPDAAHQARMETALAADSPVTALDDLATKLKAEGVSQREMYDLFDGFRTRHQAEADEAKYDAILHVMDHIAGWCQPTNRHFETDLQP